MMKGAVQSWAELKKAVVSVIRVYPEQIFWVLAGGFSNQLKLYYKAKDYKLGFTLCCSS